MEIRLLTYDNWMKVHEDKVIDFVNWYVRLHKLGVRYELENKTLIDSFKNGDDYKVWH